MVESYSNSGRKTVLQHPFEVTHKLGLGVSVGIEAINFKGCPFAKTESVPIPQT
jgi:hypothetical protein